MLIEEMPRHLLSLPTRKTHRGGMVIEIYSSAPLLRKRTMDRFFHTDWDKCLTIHKDL